MVCVGETVVPPFGLTCPTPLSRVAELALVEAHVNEVLCPERIVLGFAVKEVTVGIVGTPTKPTQPVSHRAIEPNAAHKSASLATGIPVRIISVKTILYPHSDAELLVGVALSPKREPDHLLRGDPESSGTISNDNELLFQLIAVPELPGWTSFDCHTLR